MTDAAAFRGWRVVAALAIGQGCGLGLLNAYGLLVEPLAAEFDASVAIIGAGMSIFVLSMAVSSALLGPVLDRGWIRPAMLAGVLAMIAGTTWMARATSLAELGAGLAVASCGISAYGPLPSNVVLVNWFERRRGTAIAIASAGPPVVGFFVPASTAWLLELADWRAALATLGGVLGAIALPVLAFGVIARPADVGETIDGDGVRSSYVPGPTRTTEASIAGLMRARDFWLFALGFGLYFAVPVGTGLFIVPLLLELGFSSWTAAFGATIAAAANLVGTLACGALADRFRPKPVMMGVLAIFLLALLTIGLAPAPSLVFAAVLPMTFSFGGGQPILPMLVGTRFGTDVVGRALGVIGATGLPFLIASAPLAGLLRDASGSYRAVFLGGAIAVGIAALGLAVARVRPPAD